MPGSWERLFRYISLPQSFVKRVPHYRQYARVTRNGSSSVMLPKELRKVQWLETACRGIYVKSTIEHISWV